jgi:hypothetical protein
MGAALTRARRYKQRFAILSVMTCVRKPSRTDDEVARVGDLDVGQHDAVIVGRRLSPEQRGHAGLCLGQECLQLIGVGDRCETNLAFIT